MEIKVLNLNKNFVRPNSPELKVLKNINLTIDSGQKVALTGPSGAGKSTLIHILGLMDKATLGTVLIDGQDTTKFTNSQAASMRKNNIGFMFQFHYLLSDFNVLENVLMSVWNNRKQKEKQALELLDVMGLLDRQTHMPNELSGGEQQRVALARALINNPKILFADEPTGNLDTQTGHIIEQLMFDMCTKLKTTLVLVTHSKELASLADRQIHIVDGTIK